MKTSPKRYHDENYRDPPEPEAIGECCACGCEIRAGEGRYIWPSSGDVVHADGQVLAFKINGREYRTTCFGAHLIMEHLEREAAERLGMELEGGCAL